MHTELYLIAVTGNESNQEYISYLVKLSFPKYRCYIDNAIFCSTELLSKSVNTTMLVSEKEVCPSDELICCTDFTMIEGQCICKYGCLFIF